MLNTIIKTSLNFYLLKELRVLAPILAELEPLLTEFLPHILLADFKTAVIFLFLRWRPVFFVCNPILGSPLGVQKKLGEPFFFTRTCRGNICPLPPCGEEAVSEPAWNRVKIHNMLVWTHFHPVLPLWSAFEEKVRNLTFCVKLVRKQSAFDM